MNPGHGRFGPKGLDWQDLCRGPLIITLFVCVETTKHCYMIICLSLCLMVSEKKIFEGSLAI